MYSHRINCKGFGYAVLLENHSMNSINSIKIVKQECNEKRRDI